MKKFSAKKYAAAFYEATTDMNKTQVDEAAESLVKILFKNKGLKLTERIIAEFVAYDKKQSGIIDAVVYSARPLTDVVKKNVAEKIRQVNKVNKVNVENIVDEELLGGIVVKVGDQVLDASVRTGLEDLRQSLI